MQTSRILIRPSGTLPGQEINWRIDNGHEFLCCIRYFIAYVLCIYGEQMNIDKKIKDLDKHIKYIKKVLKEKQDERFCAYIQRKQERNKQNQN